MVLLLLYYIILYSSLPFLSFCSLLTHLPHSFYPLLIYLPFPFFLPSFLSSSPFFSPNLSSVLLPISSFLLSSPILISPYLFFSSLPLILLFPTLVHPDLSVNSKYTCRVFLMFIYILSFSIFPISHARII